MANHEPTDDQQPAPGGAASKGKAVRLVCAWPTDVFRHGIEGAEPVTAGGTDVPADLADAIRDAAKRSHVTLREVR